MQRPAGKGEVPVFAIKLIGEAHQVFFQRRRNRDNFKGGPRLNHVGDDAVTRVGGDGAGLVRIKVRIRSQRQNFAGARTHDDAGDALRGVLLQRFGQRGFHDVLHRRIQGQHDVQTIPRVDIFVPQGN